MKRILTGFALFTALILTTQCNKQADATDQTDDTGIVELVRAGVLDNIDNPAEATTNREITEFINRPTTTTTTVQSTTTTTSRTQAQTAGSGQYQVEEVLQPGPGTRTTTTTTTVQPQVIEMRTHTTVPVTAEPVEPVVTQPVTRDQSATGSRTETTVTQTPQLTVIQQTTVIQGNTIVNGQNYPANCYIKVGQDATIEAAAPRQYTKITMAVFSSLPNACYVDFQIYAIPTTGGLSRTGANMIGYAYNIEIINGQAQMTKYWNGKNVYGHFLAAGNYNIYLYYKIKDANGKVLKTDGRYWGNNRSYYIKLS